MEDSRSATSSQRLARNFETLLETPELRINAIFVVRSEKISEGRSVNIPVSVQELFYGCKPEGVGTSAKLVDRDNELLPSSKEALGPRTKQKTF
ncbi:hypothetical protein O181_048166 [Austropuccinia psidii MF-1]|uniref:Uncharacterized protein n=1 Tax=Austropuccinia psidii MF-1 TaxID=1389203 RepID=A0A9Q3HK53_9BASI|nr:hypothetical protein [Austropuccinia psidii MF-1]